MLIIVFFVISSSLIQQFCCLSTTPSSLFQVGWTLDVRIWPAKLPGDADTSLRLCVRQPLMSPSGMPRNRLACPFGQTDARPIRDGAHDLPLIEHEFSNKLSWPQSFSLIIQLARQTRQDQGSGAASSSSDVIDGEEVINDGVAVVDSTIFEAILTKNDVHPSDQWSQRDVVTNGSISMSISYRVRCDDGLYGAMCTERCVPRNNRFGHVTCERFVGAKCLPGWKVDPAKAKDRCTKAICKENCSSTGGMCNEPGECRCKEGWMGENCNVCRPKLNCQHGTCSKPGECICEKNWTGENCDTPVNFCALKGDRCRENGGKCENLPGGRYQCVCPFRRSGVDCEELSSHCNASPCQNGGTCTDIDTQPGYTCTCPMSATGKNCEKLVDSPVFVGKQALTTKNDGESTTLIVEGTAAAEVGEPAGRLTPTQLALVIVFGVGGPFAIFLILGVACALRNRRRRFLQEHQQHRQFILTTNGPVPTICAISTENKPCSSQNVDKTGDFNKPISTSRVGSLDNVRSLQRHGFKGAVNDVDLRKASRSVLFAPSFSFNDPSSSGSSTQNHLNNTNQRHSFHPTLSDHHFHLQNRHNFLAMMPPGCSAALSSPSSSNTANNLLQPHHFVIENNNNNNNNNNNSNCYDLPPPYSPQSNVTLEDCV